MDAVKTFSLLEIVMNHFHTYPEDKIQNKNHIFHTTADICKIGTPPTMHFRIDYTNSKKQDSLYLLIQIYTCFHLITMHFMVMSNSIDLSLICCRPTPVKSRHRLYYYRYQTVQCAIQKCCQLRVNILKS